MPNTSTTTTYKANPYAPRMRAADAVTEAALARIEARRDLPRTPGGRGQPRWYVEHRTGSGTQVRAGDQVVASRLSGVASKCGTHGG